MVYVSRLFLQSGCHLDAGSSVSDCGNAFALWVEARIPVRRVAKVTLEFLDAWISWQFPFVEMAVRSNDEIEVEIVGSRLRNIRDVQAPLGLLRIPLRGVDLRVEAAFRVDIELLGN